MIIVKLKGQLGNNLFEIAAGATLAARVGAELRVFADPEDILPNGISSRENANRHRETIFSKVKFIDELPKNLPTFENSLKRFEEIPQKDNQILDGYFQDWRYIDAAIVRELFACPEALKAKIFQKNPILNEEVYAVHVRRNDYLKCPEVLPVCREDYFKSAMTIIGNDKKFIVCSDDVAWCKEHFGAMKNVFYSACSSAIEDFYLMTFCRGNVICNSTFSWWAALLNEANQRDVPAVVAPERWWGIHAKKFAKTGGLRVPNWRFIPRERYFGDEFIAVLNAFQEIKIIRKTMRALHIKRRVFEIKK